MKKTKNPHHLQKSFSGKRSRIVVFSRTDETDKQTGALIYLFRQQQEQQSHHASNKSCSFFVRLAGGAGGYNGHDSHHIHRGLFRAAIRCDEDGRFECECECEPTTTTTIHYSAALCETEIQVGFIRGCGRQQRRREHLFILLYETHLLYMLVLPSFHLD